MKSGALPKHLETHLTLRGEAGFSKKTAKKIRGLVFINFKTCTPNATVQLWWQCKVPDNGDSCLSQHPNALGSAPIYSKEQARLALRNLQSSKRSPLGQGYSSWKYLGHTCSVAQSTAFRRSRNVTRIHMSCFQERCFGSTQSRREYLIRTASGKAPTLLLQCSHCSQVIFHESPRIFSKWQSHSNRYAASDLETGVKKVPWKMHILTIQ